MPQLPSGCNVLVLTGHNIFWRCLTSKLNSPMPPRPSIISPHHSCGSSHFGVLRVKTTVSLYLLSNWNLSFGWNFKFVQNICKIPSLLWWSKFMTSLHLSSFSILKVSENNSEYYFSDLQNTSLCIFLIWSTLPYPIYYHRWVYMWCNCFLWFNNPSWERNVSHKRSNTSLHGSGRSYKLHGLKNSTPEL